MTKENKKKFIHEALLGSLVFVVLWIAISKSVKIDYFIVIGTVVVYLLVAVLFDRDEWYCKAIAILALPALLLLLFPSKRVKAIYVELGKIEKGQ